MENIENTEDVARGKKDLTFSTKVSKDVHEKAYKLLEQSGLPTLKEWFESAVAVMELHQMQGSEAEQAQDSQQMKFHLNRVQDLFLNQVQKVFDLRVAFDEQLANENRLHKGIVDSIQAEKVNAETERDAAVLEKNRLEREMAELAGRNAELETQYRLAAQTIEIIQSRNAVLEKEIGETGALWEQIRKLKEEHAETVKELEAVYREKEKVEADAERKASQIQNRLLLEMEKALAQEARKGYETIEALRQEHIKREREILEKNEKLVERIHELELRLKDYETKEEMEKRN